MAEEKAAKTQIVGSTFDLLGKSAEIVKKYWQLFALASIPALLSAVFSIFPGEKADTSIVNSFLGFQTGGNFSVSNSDSVGLTLLVVLLMCGVYIFFEGVTSSLSVKVTKGQKPSAGQVFDEGLRYFPKFLGLNLLYGMAIVIGLLLLIVPGVIIFYRLIFAQYIMFDQKLGVMDSLRKSWDMTRGNAGPVWSAIGVMVVAALAVGFLSIIPIVGPIAGTILGIAWSLVIVLRYMQMRGVNIGKSL